MLGRKCSQPDCEGRHSRGDEVRGQCFRGADLDPKDPDTWPQRREPDGRPTIIKLESVRVADTPTGPQIAQRFPDGTWKTTDGKPWIPPN